MKKWITFVMMLLPLLMAAKFSAGVDVPVWQLTRSGQDAMLPLLMKPGNPALPYYPVKVLIPMGEKITGIYVKLNNGETARSNVSLDYVRTPQPVSKAVPDITQKNLAVWLADASYPTDDYTYLGTQRYKGYELAIINVYAWHYNPVTQQLVSATSAEIEIETVADSDLRASQNVMLTSDRSFSDLLSRTIANPEQIRTYSKTTSSNHSSRTVNPANPKKLIIITSQSRISWFTDYVTWKESKGISTGIFAIEDILSEYTGVDNPAKLRSFILDAYTTWNQTTTPLEYVILGGDDEFIPIRGVYGQVGDTLDEWMPCDLYYGCLDGSWNADGDNLWGEYPSDQPDLLPEVYVGRFPAETQAEFQHIMDKTKFYSDNATFSNNIVNLYGENLNWNPLTWGGDYKDDVALHIPNTYMKNTYYQRDGTYSPEVVINTINSGAGIMNHMGHANQTFLLGQGNSTIEALTNTEYGFLYSQGCYPAAFDQRTSGIGESIGEHLVTANGALYAFIGNTRYGWYSPGSIDGPSEYFDRQFFVGMFEQNLPQLGKAMEYSLLQNLNYAMSEDVMLWCYYETILFGDPTTSVKPADPALPCLSLESYRYDDSEGDGDGNLNPGELIRLYVKVQNLPGWGAASNVMINTEGLPEGVLAQICHLSIPQIQGGAYADTTMYISFQLPVEMAFGTYDFSIRLRASDPSSGAIVCDRSYAASMSITLLDSHFPWDCFFSGKSAPAVLDYNFDGSREVLYVDVTGNGYFVNAEGQLIDSFTMPIEGESINKSFAVTRMTPDVQYHNQYVFTSRSGQIWSMTDTLGIWGDYPTNSTCLWTPIATDIDHDGYLDIIASAHNKKVYALTGGTILKPGFPVELSAPFNCELAVADLDGDSYKEIIAGTTDGKLWVIEHNGVIKNGFPVQLSGSITGSPIILNNNRIVVGTDTKMYVIAPDGTIFATKTIEDDMASGAIPVDLNLDGELDIAFVTIGGDLYACRQDGTNLPGFPLSIGGFFNCPPLAADVDSDHQYEIILQSNFNSVYIVNHNGSIATGFPFPMSYNGSTPATLTDFDEDGNYELVSGYSNGVLVIKLRRPLGNLDAWTVYRGSLSREGSYAATGFVGNSDEVAITEIALAANYPNPFNPETKISFSLPKAEQQVSLIIYNSKGQKVKTLYQGNSAKGSHNLAWNGKDDNGIQVSSGIYLYRLQTSGTSLSRKMLLLK